MNRYVKYLCLIAAVTLACFFAGDVGGDYVRRAAGAFIAAVYRGALLIAWAWATLRLAKRGLMVGYGAKPSFNEDGTMKAWSFWSEEIKLSIDISNGEGWIQVERGKITKDAAGKRSVADRRSIKEKFNAIDFQSTSLERSDSKTMHSFEHSQERRTATVFTTSGPVTVSGMAKVTRRTAVGEASEKNGMHDLFLDYKESEIKPFFNFSASRQNTGDGFSIHISDVDSQLLSLFENEWNKVKPLIDQRGKEILDQAVSTVKGNGAASAQ